MDDRPLTIRLISFTSQPDVFGKPPLRDAQGLQKLLRQDLIGCGSVSSSTYIVLRS